MLKLSKIFLSTIAITALSGAPVYADSYGYYGSTPVTSCLAIDKTVSNPASKNLMEFVDNVTVRDAKYKPDQTLMERAKIKNISNKIIPGVKITSVVPQHIKYISGPVTFNKGGTEFTIEVGDLQPQEEKTYFITFVARGEKELPNQPLIIFSNTIKAQGSICNAVEDTAQMIIERNVLAATTKGGQPIAELKNMKNYPQTGPEYGVLILALQAGVASLGYMLKKQAN